MKLYETMKKALALKGEPSMWKNFNAILLNCETHQLKDVCSKTRDVYACVNGHEICVVMMDKVAKCELADEEPFNGESPLYFTENSHRVSPVFFLSSLCEDLRMYPGFCNASVSGILLTASEIINEEDMQDIWDSMNVAVRSSVKEMKYTLAPNLDSELWKEIAEYLGEKNKGDNVDLHIDMKKIQPPCYTAADTPEPAGKSVSSKKRKELLLEDIIDKSDPVFHTLTGDGNSVFVSANLPNIKVLPPIEDSAAVLEQMVGLEHIKGYIVKLKNLVLFKKKLIECFPEIKCPEVSLHSVFAGSPGTGKSSVALLYASLLKEAGILSKGNLLMCNGRDAFMARWVGSEEKNVRMALSAAKGNVLLIDEAYTLVTPNELDYARQVLPLMLQLLADEEYRDVAVILCGYSSEMEYLLSSNPGLKSRFPNYVMFEDYSVDELHKMAVNKIKRNGYILQDEAEEKIMNLLQAMYDTRKEGQWANGREVSNIYDKIIITHADRCISSEAEGEMLITITPEDIPDMEKAVVRNTRRIGFR